MSNFSQRLIDWHRQHGRHDLPWQNMADPYRVWVSEIMLQQTQVATVIPYYQRFLDRFPTLGELAAAQVEEVMVLWSGLGYYARARNLHRCAQMLVEQHDGRFPADPAVIASLPGIGRSTANAIAAFCFGVRVPILDGNVKRLLCRHLGIAGYPGATEVESRLWRDGEVLLPESDVATYIQAQMDLGASICTRSRPKCANCPVAADCVARREGRTAELPTPRPKRGLPEKPICLLAVFSDGRVLLESRPPAGIWGGLLSLPELPAGQDAASYCRQSFGVYLDVVAPGPTFVHGFTHFRLQGDSLVCTGRPGMSLSEPGLRWLAADDLARAALPAPVRKLLFQLFSVTP